VRAAEHCPISILQAHGGGAIPRLALWTIDRFVRFLSELAVDLPLPKVDLRPAPPRRAGGACESSAPPRHRHVRCHVDVRMWADSPQTRRLQVHTFMTHSFLELGAAVVSGQPASSSTRTVRLYTATCGFWERTTARAPS
jgi:hypothetical protein